MVPWNPTRTKVQIKLSVQRLRSLQEKKLALAKKSRREIADLLQKGRTETCRLRVEGLIQDDIYVELLEVMELYAETLQARFGLLDASSGETPEASIADAVCAIIYAAPRTELKELQVLREMLMHKTDPPPPQVPARVLSKLKVFVPPKELVDAYLGEIAKGYGISWLPEPSFSENDGGAGDDADDGGTKESSGKSASGNGDVNAVEKASSGNGESTKAVDGGEDGATRRGSGDMGSKQMNEAAPSSRTQNTVPAPPAGPEKDAWASAGNGGTNGGGKPAKKLTEEEELAARFERLQRLK